MRKPLHALSLALLSSLVGLRAQAAPSTVPQGVPDAGQLLQQIEKNQAPALPSKTKQALPPAPEAMRPLPGLTVTVKQFRFVGNTLLDSTVLAPVVADYLGRALDFAGLQQAAAAVAEVYRQAGWIVRVYFPQQEIADGVVTIQIVEAVFGGVRIDGKASRVVPERLQQTVDHAQAAGEPLNARRLDRALLLLGDLPGQSVAGSLRRGSQERATDLVLTTADTPFLNGGAGVDNYGARSTGAARATADAYLNSPLHLGDQLSANLILSQGSDYGRLAYTLPLGYDGWRVGASASELHYHLVAAEFERLHANGTSGTVGLNASYPLLRSRTANLYLGLYADHKRFNNEANYATTSNYAANTRGVGMSGNLFDTLGGGGANSATLTLTQGTVGSGHADLDDGSTSADSSRYSKLRYGLSRQQSLSDQLALYAALSGQQSSRNLDSSEKFYLGGPDGVRAYPMNEGGGDDGQLLSLEARWQAGSNLKLIGFYDWGHVQVNHDNRSGFKPASYALSGLGATLAWQLPSGLNLQGSLAHRLGSNPNPTATGNDQDGSHNLNRFWLNATMPF